MASQYYVLCVLLLGLQVPVQALPMQGRLFTTPEQRLQIQQQLGATPIAKGRVPLPKEKARLLKNQQLYRRWYESTTRPSGTRYQQHR